MVHGPGTLRAGDPGIETPVSVYLRPTPGRPPMEAEALRLFIRSKLNDGRLPYNSMPILGWSRRRGNVRCLRHAHHERAVSDGGHCLHAQRQEARSISRPVLLRLGCREARAEVVASPPRYCSCMSRSLPRLVALLAARYRPAKRLDIRRWYRACRLVLMPAARSVSSGLTVISSPASRAAASAPAPRSNVSMRV